MDGIHIIAYDKKTELQILIRIIWNHYIESTFVDKKTRICFHISVK